MNADGRKSAGFELSSYFLDTILDTSGRLGKASGGILHAFPPRLRDLTQPPRLCPPKLLIPLCDILEFGVQ